MKRDNTVLARSLAHSHIKSNSFIFTFIHPGRPGRAGGQEGLTEGLLWQGQEALGGSPTGQGRAYAKGSPISSSGPRPRSSRFSSVLAREWRLP